MPRRKNPGNPSPNKAYTQRTITVCQRLFSQRKLDILLCFLAHQYQLPLGVSSFTESQADKIQRKAVELTLPKIEINQNTSRALVYGPTKFGGIGLYHLYA